MQFEAPESPEDTRIGRAMGILNSVTHPVWMLGTIVLLIVGQGRWVMPLMVFVIGAHFLPIAHILGRWVDYPAGLLMIAFAVIGGTIATGFYAIYMAKRYGQMTRAAGLSFP